MAILRRIAMKLWLALTETDKAAAREPVVLDEHQKKTMDFIEGLGELLAKP